VTATVTAAGPPRVAEVRSFVGRRRRRPWYDWYSMAFAVVLTVILLWDLLAQPFGRRAAMAARRRPRRWRAPRWWPGRRRGC
jgi:ABC-type branched-subunit amino acid transport system permease subunit